MYIDKGGAIAFDDVVFLTTQKQKKVWLYRVTGVDTIPEINKVQISLKELTADELPCYSTPDPPAEPFVWMGWMDLHDEYTADLLTETSQRLMVAHRAQTRPAPFWVPGILGPVQPQMWQAYRSIVDTVVVMPGGKTKLIVDDAFYTDKVWRPGDAIHIVVGIVGDSDSLDSISCRVRYLGRWDPDPAGWDVAFRACMGKFVIRESHPHYLCCSVITESAVARFKASD